MEIASLKSSRPLYVTVPPLDQQSGVQVRPAMVAMYSHIRISSRV